MQNAEQKSLPPIEPDRLYSFAEAARLIPSPRPGKRTSILTLHRWRKRGHLEACCSQRGMKRWWFVRGSELLRKLPPVGEAGEPAPEIRSPADRRRGYERAMKNLRAAGLVT